MAGESYKDPVPQPATIDATKVGVRQKPLKVGGAPVDAAAADAAADACGPMSPTKIVTSESDGVGPLGGV